MKINEKIISLPPYISTSWRNICAIHMKGSLLIISMLDGDVIEIPGLKSDVIEVIFKSHAQFLEEDEMDHEMEIAPHQSKQSSHLLNSNHSSEQTMEFPFKLGFGSIDGLGSALQHNPAQAKMPDLPPEMLNKISAIAKILSPADAAALPKAEPHCNCVYCQIARALGGNLQNSNDQDDELVSDDELSFQQWNITQTGEKLFTVVNKLDVKEKYNVYLGKPVGCTCGKEGCEHILAVLKT